MNLARSMLAQLGWMWIAAFASSGWALYSDERPTTGNIRLYSGSSFDWNLANDELRILTPDAPDRNDAIWKHDGNLWRVAGGPNWDWCNDTPDYLTGSNIFIPKFEESNLCLSYPDPLIPQSDASPLGSGESIVIGIPWFNYYRADLDVDFTRNGNQLVITGTMTLPQLTLHYLDVPGDLREEYLLPIESLPAGEYSLTVALNARFDGVAPGSPGEERLPPFSYSETIRFNVIPEPAPVVLMAMAPVLGFVRRRTHHWERREPAPHVLPSAPW